MSRIEQMIRELPSELQQEVLDFVEFLIEKRAQKRGGKLRQDWAGALRDYRDQYTSLELQKRALEWRGDWPMYLVDTKCPASGRKKASFVKQHWLSRTYCRTLEV